MTTGKAKAAGGANAKLLGTTKRSNGTQVTYNGHPLCTFFEDTKAGRTNGQGSIAFGAPWYVMGTNGNKIVTGWTAPAEVRGGARNRSGAAAGNSLVARTPRWRYPCAVGQ